MSQINVNHVYDLNGGAKVVVHGSLDTPLGMRNKIINGKMDIAQRGTSFAAIADNAYSLDRWQHADNTAAVGTISQAADAPSDNEFQNSLRYTVTTADTAIAATDVVTIRQHIEGYNIRDLIGRTFTMSFRVRSPKTGTHCVVFKNTGNDRAYIATYTVNAVNTWEPKTVTVVGGLPVAGTWDYTDGRGLTVAFVLAAGSNFHTSSDAWQAGDFYATAAQVNVVDTVGAIFAFTGVQLEIGELAPSFEHRPYGLELALCQRYYCTCNIDFCVYQGAGSGFRQRFPYPVQMRATPTFGTSGVSYVNASTVGMLSATNRDVSIGATATAAGPCSVSGVFTAAAEL